MKNDDRPPKEHHSGPEGPLTQGLGDKLKAAGFAIPEKVVFDQGGDDIERDMLRALTEPLEDV